jgi:tricarballylate dehydrogenase
LKQGYDVVAAGAGNAAFCAGHLMEGLYAAGELAGGLFYHNYPGGSELTSGTVSGCRAGAFQAS